MECKEEEEGGKPFLVGERELELEVGTNLEEGGRKGFFSYFPPTTFPKEKGEKERVCKATSFPNPQLLYLFTSLSPAERRTKKGDTS